MNPAHESAAPNENVSAAASSERWSLKRKLLFRVALIYFAITIFPYPLPRFRVFWPLTEQLTSLTQPIVRAAGVRLLSLPEERRLVGGCGDRADHYVGALIGLAVALAAAALWSCGDRRPNHRRLAYWTSVALRYYVGYTMLEYGIIKILKSQFPFPGPDLLVSSVGELPPMRLLWVLMGISAPYTAFIGLCEFLGGSLLFFRRTVLVGALLTFGVLLNVFLMNLFYGVCVKLFSARLLLMTGILLLPDGRRLVDALLLGRAVPASGRARPEMSARFARALSAAKLVIVPGLLTLAVRYGHGAWHSYGDAAPRSGLHGVWDVESFARNGQLIPAHSSDGSRWEWLAVGSEDRADLRRAAGKRSIHLSVDAGARSVQLSLDTEKKSTATLRYAEPEPGVLELSGELEGAPTVIRLKQRPLERLPLVSYRWRWTSDL